MYIIHYPNPRWSGPFKAHWYVCENASFSLYQWLPQKVYLTQVRRDQCTSVWHYTHSYWKVKSVGLMFSVAERDTDSSGRLHAGPAWWATCCCCRTCTRPSSNPPTLMYKQEMTHSMPLSSPPPNILMPSSPAGARNSHRRSSSLEQSSLKVPLKVRYSQGTGTFPWDVCVSFIYLYLEQ